MYYIGVYEFWLKKIKLSNLGIGYIVYWKSREEER